MAHDWIIDVLTDLKAFARANGLPALAEHLDETHLVAQVEIASHTKGTAIGLRGTDEPAGHHSSAAGIR